MAKSRALGMMVLACHMSHPAIVWEQSLFLTAPCLQSDSCSSPLSQPPTKATKATNNTITAKQQHQQEIQDIEYTPRNYLQLPLSLIIHRPFNRSATQHPSYPSSHLSNLPVTNRVRTPTISGAQHPRNTRGTGHPSGTTWAWRGMT